MICPLTETKSRGAQPGNSTMFMHPAIIRRTGIFQCLRAVGHPCGRRVLHDAQRNEQIHSDTDQLNGRILADRRYDIRKSEELVNKCCESSQERQQPGLFFSLTFQLIFIRLSPL